MNRNPVSIEESQRKYLMVGWRPRAPRDGYKHEKTELSMKDLRYKVAVTIVEDKMFYFRAAEKFDVSKNFMFKWSRIYRAKVLQLEVQKP